MYSAAVISPDDMYRYELVRIWDASLPLLSVVMVNPSTADHTKNDPTIVKVMEFARRLGYGGVIVVNLFAFRATDVNELKLAADPVGPLNRVYIECAMLRTRTTLVAWGSSAKLPKELRLKYLTVLEIAWLMKRPLYCLTTCQDGHPKHPVMIGYDTPFVEWNVPV